MRNEPTKTKPENINIAVNKDGQMFWNQPLVPDQDAARAPEGAAVLKPQPEVHVRADQNVRYEYVGRW